MLKVGTQSIKKKKKNLKKVLDISVSNLEAQF